MRLVIEVTPLEGRGEWSEQIATAASFHGVAGKAPAGWMPGGRSFAMRERFPKLATLPASLDWGAGDAMLAASLRSIGALAWRRSAASRTDAMSLLAAVRDRDVVGRLPDLLELAVGPYAPSDLVVYSSQAAYRVAKVALRAYAEMLKGRFGIRSIELPSQVVIPPGVEWGYFGTLHDGRDACRENLRAAESDVVLVVRGKAEEVLALARAFEQIGREGGDLSRYQVIVACPPTVVVQELESLVDRAVAAGMSRWRWEVVSRFAEFIGLLVGADALLWLPHVLARSEQEDLLSAMAMSLPVVASGIGLALDLVRDAATGFLVPLQGTPTGLWSADDAGLDPEAEVVSGTAVDLRCLSNALTRLQDSGLRRGIGRAARKSVERLDWSNVLQTWSAQALDARAGARVGSMPRHTHPAAMDPSVFQRASGVGGLKQDDQVSLSAELAGAMADAPQGRALDAAISVAQSLVSRRSVAPPRVSKGDLKLIVASLAGGPESVGDLVHALPVERQRNALRAITWGARMGLLELLPPATLEFDVNLERIPAEARGG